MNENPKHNTVAKVINKSHHVKILRRCVRRDSSKVEAWREERGKKKPKNLILTHRKKRNNKNNINKGNQGIYNAERNAAYTIRISPIAN